MKLRYKITIAVAAATAILLIILLILEIISPEKSSAANANTTPQSNILTAIPEPGISPEQSDKFKRHTSLLAVYQSPGINLDSPDLNSRIKQCAAAMVLAVLPEYSEAAPAMDLQLIDQHTARVTGQAFIAGSGQTPEIRLNFSVMVNFLPDGSCEALFPLFSEQ